MTSTLQDLRYEVEGAEAPSPTAADRSNIAAYQKYFTGYYGGIMPEDEIRQLYRISSSGAVGEWLGHPFANQAIQVDLERFSIVQTPAFAIFPFPNALNHRCDT